MKYFLVAGEQSGDLHGSNLIRELIKADTQAEIFCWGGDLMEAAGARLLMHYRRTAFMGFTVILKNLRVIFKNLAICRNQILDFNPDAVILIDYPGFNLRIAKFAKESGIRVIYYISPKFWAWNESRVKKVKKYVDRMYIIFPFEKRFYEKHGIDSHYFGNPLVDEIEKQNKLIPSKESAAASLKLDDRPVIAILAGSRRLEVEHILPPVVKMTRRYPQYQFVLAAVNNLPESLYKRVIKDAPVKVVYDRTYEILSISEAAVIKSGTATLETALFSVPQVVGYRGDFFSMLIAVVVIKVKFISLVNLIMDKEVVRELLGYSLNEKNLSRELDEIIQGGRRRERILNDYRDLKSILGGPGASERTACDIFSYLSSNR